MVLDTRKDEKEIIREKIELLLPEVDKKRKEEIFRLLVHKKECYYKLTMDEIIERACEFFEIPFEQIIKKDNRPLVVDKRYMMMSIINNNTRELQGDIGKRFKRDRTIVIVANQKVKDLCDTYENFRNTYNELNNYIFK